jgi:hypothetical protein
MIKPRTLKGFEYQVGILNHIYNETPYVAVIVKKGDVEKIDDLIVPDVYPNVHQLELVFDTVPN